MEKLSSGFRINRAGDDAAGLAISEKMRGQIRGLTQASRNAQDGISLIQTAEGALNETHAILQRMRELAVQSSTDTNTDADRVNIQDEIDQLTAEITRIAETTEFNTMKLLDGNYKDKKFHIGSNEGQNITFDVNDMTSKALGLESANKQTATVDGVTYETQNSEIKEIEVVIDAAGATGANAELVDGKLTVTLSTQGGDPDLAAINTALEKHGVKASGTVGTTGGTETLEAKTHTIGGITEAYANIADKDITKLTFAANDAQNDDKITIEKNNDGEVTVTAGQKVTLKQLNDALKDYGITINSNDKDVKADTVLGSFNGNEEVDVDAGNIAIRVDSQENADKAITTIDNALENVSKERSKLGAYQNRLEHTIKNLDNVAENLQAAESRIRDVDMAKEMMEQTRQNILQQASTAMLAQANQAPQTVLQLLR
jgi:flagellin